MNATSNTVELSLSESMREDVATAIYLRLGYMETGTRLRRNDAIDMKEYDCIKKLDHEQERLIVNLEDVAIRLRSKGPVRIERDLVEHVRISIEVRLSHIETGTLMRAADAAIQNQARSSSRFPHDETIAIRVLTEEQKQLVRDLEQAVKMMLEAQFPSMAGAHRTQSVARPAPAQPARRGFKSVQGR